jgi:hypothetical protein
MADDDGRRRRSVVVIVVPVPAAVFRALVAPIFLPGALPLPALALFPTLMLFPAAAGLPRLVPVVIGPVATELRNVLITSSLPPRINPSMEPFWAYRRGGTLNAKVMCGSPTSATDNL